MKVKKILFVLVLLLVPIFCFAENQTNSTSTFQTESIFEEFFPEPSLLLSDGCGTIFCDDFNSYNDGDLNSQGGWYEVGYNSFKVVVGDSENPESVSYGKQVNNVVYGDPIVSLKTGTALSDGRIIYYIKRTKNNSGELDFILGADSVPNSIYIVFYQDGHIYYLTTGYTFIDYGTYNDNQWYLVEIEWRSSDYKYRVKCGLGAWTDWIIPPNIWGAGIHGLNVVKLDSYHPNGTDSFDYIAENPYTPPPPATTTPYIVNTFYIFWFVFSEYFFAIWVLALFVSIVVALVYLTSRR
jgi:hypothetical protein